jgi:hypothetical protein
MAAGFGPAVALTSGIVRNNAPDLGVLPNGDLVVVYQTNLGQDIFYKRAPLSGLAGAAAQPVATLADAESQPRVLVVGDMLVFFYYASPPGHWFYRRFRHTTNAWIDGAGVQLTTGAALPAGNAAHAAVDGAGAIWFACRGAATEILALRYVPASNVVSPPATLDLADVDSQPFILPSTSGDVWALWRNALSGLVLARNTGGVWGAAGVVPGTAAGDRSPTAVEDPSGGIWTYFVRGGSGDLFVTRRDAVTGGWSTARQVTFSPGNDVFPHAVLGPRRETWLFWNSDRDGNTNNYFKQIFTTV